MKWLIKLLSSLFKHHHHKPPTGCHPEYIGKGNAPGFPNDRPVVGERFDHQWYLQQNPDVAGDACYHDKPYAHYCDSGRAEGRKPYPATSPVPPPAGKRELMRIGKESFFSLCRRKDGTLLAGTYSYPDPNAKIYNVNTHQLWHTYAGVGESVFCMLDDGNHFWTACEDKGMTFVDHRPYVTMPPSHQWRGAYTVQTIMGKTVFVNAGSVYVDGVGEVLRWGNYHNKNIVEWMGSAYVVGYNYDRDQGCVFRTPDLLNWKESNAPTGWRFMDAATRGDDKVYLVGTVNYRGGKHHRDSAALFVTHDMINFQLIRTFTGFDYISKIRAGDTGRIVFGTTRGWRSQKPGCDLYEVTINGNINKLANFKDAELRDIIIEKNKIIVATRTDTIGGSVWEVYN